MSAIDDIALGSVRRLAAVGLAVRREPFPAGPGLDDFPVAPTAFLPCDFVALDVVAAATPERASRTLEVGIDALKVLGSAGPKNRL
jgi:hypothetical protein